MFEGERLIAGAMSGTSADGVDVAIVAITGRGLEMTVKLIYHDPIGYPPELRQKIFAAREKKSLELGELAKLGREISLCYAKAVNGALLVSHLSASDLSAVAAHGQTLYHAPPDTIQWLDPALLAAEVGCPVVSDFRRADCAAGGQGAPLVPFADYILFRHSTQNRVLLNIGGIANLTWLKAGGSIEDVIAFDTGPGNCISDWICRTKGPFGLSWDVDGQGASRGRVMHEIVELVLSNPYFKRLPPKSTDGPEMVEAFVHSMNKNGADDAEMNDLLATAAFLTAATIQQAIARLKVSEAEVLVSGGGCHNKAIMTWLSSRVGDRIRVGPLEDRNCPPDAKEAIAFALLGAATLDGVPSNVPSVTGAKKAVVLGSITPKP